MEIAKENLLNKDEYRCPECKNSNNMRYCYKEGELVCTSCGFVAQQNFIDQGAEWRNFSEGSASGTDPRRAFGMFNSSLIDGGIGFSFLYLLYLFLYFLFFVFNHFSFYCFTHNFLYFFDFFFYSCIFSFLYSYDYSFFLFLFFFSFFILFFSIFFNFIILISIFLFKRNSYYGRKRFL